LRDLTQGDVCRLTASPATFLMLVRASSLCPGCFASYAVSRVPGKPRPSQPPRPPVYLPPTLGGDTEGGTVCRSQRAWAEVS
jgi:hypothetical protein